MAKLDTSIDRLVDFVRLKNSCTVDEVAKSLGLASKQVEELSEILAESGLIDIRYEFSGIRLFPKIVKKETALDASVTGKKLSVIDRLDGVKKELTDAENMFVFSERDILRKVENAKAHFREIERLDISAEKPEELLRKFAELDSSLLVFEKKIESLTKAAVDVKQEVDGFEAQLSGASEGKGIKLASVSLKNIMTNIAGKIRRKGTAGRVDAK
ncbi:MAG: hypothetical protein ABH863_01890 [Candidatus Micrarchaeota archaeon]